MIHLLFFGTLWFWIAIGITSGIIFSVMGSALEDDDHDSGGGLIATAVIAGFGILYYFFGSKEHVEAIFQYFIEYPGRILGWFGLYLLVGVVWAFFKWYFYLHKRIRKEEKEMNRWENHVIKIPTAADNKFRIMSWMIYWPFSLIWTAIDQPVRNTFNYLFNRFEIWFDKMSKSMFKDVVEKSVKLKEVREAEEKRREDERLDKLNKKENDRLAREKQLKKMEGGEEIE